MTSKTVRLWAHSADDLQTLKGLMRAEFGAQTQIRDKGAYVWRNTGPQREDTRIGMTRALEGDHDNPTLRFLAETQVEGDEALLTLSQKLEHVAAALPANHAGSFAFGNAVVMKPAKFQVIQNEILEQEAPLAAIA